MEIFIFYFFELEKIFKKKVCVSSFERPNGCLLIAKRTPEGQEVPSVLELEQKKSQQKNSATTILLKRKRKGVMKELGKEEYGAQKQRSLDYRQDILFSQESRNPLRFSQFLDASHSPDLLNNKKKTSTEPTVDHCSIFRVVYVVSVRL